MRTLIILLVSSFACCAYAGESIDALLQSAARHAVSAYQAHGWRGLVAESYECYKAHGATFECVNFDIAAGYINRTYVTDKDKLTEYFGQDAFLERARPLLKDKNGWDMATANAYLQFADEIVGKEIATKLK
jgi:hypothetical protein